MRRLILILVLVPLAIIVIVLSIANRHLVTLSIDPLGGAASSLSIAAPLFVMLFAAVAVGIIIGGSATYIRQGHWRRLARNERAELTRRDREAQRSPQEPPAHASANAMIPARRDAA